MQVSIPSALLSYTNGAAVVAAEGATVDEVLRDLDRRYQGLRFRVIDEQDRIRRHMKVFVNNDQVDDVRRAVRADDRVHLLMALSGG